MKRKEFNKLTDREKWTVFWDKDIKLKGNWHCKHCGALMADEEPYRAAPFSGCSVHCDFCDGELTRRTGGGQSDPFNWKLKKKK